MDVYKEWLGIPEGERPPDHYTLLRVVKFEDDVEKIRKNYTKLNAHVRKYASGQYSVQSQELLNELAKAMLCLTDEQRKREYDLSLGREFDDKQGLPGRLTVGQYLISEGHLSESQVAEAESFAESRGLDLRDALVQMKLVDAELATRALASELGYSVVDLATMTPDDSVLDKVPRQLVKRNSILPLFVDDDVLLVASVHEPSPELEEEIRLRYGVPMRPVLAPPLAINQGIAKYYAPGMRDEVVDESETASKKKSKGAKGKATKPQKKSSSKTDPQDAHQQKMLSIIILCWGTIGSVLLDRWVIMPLLFGRKASFTLIFFSCPFLITLIVVPALAFYVYKNYWS
ncbi:MAG: hypothetical protein Tsb009_32060 [Planctomycetaceae bacterium]